MAINRKRLFDGIRHAPFPGKMKQTQVDGINVILDAWEKSGQKDLRHLAYILATPAIETGMRYEPIIEAGGESYFRRLYDVQGQNPARARSMGNTQPGDGARYRGRGFVQITWKKNYARYRDQVQKLFGVDILANPDKAMIPEVAAYIMVDGMTKGVFTGKKLADYFNAKTTDWRNARRIVNGLDKADQIASIAKEFYADLVAASA
jgi:putative chitinase